MSFFKKKLVTVEIRDVNLTFRALSQKELLSVKYFGKFSGQQIAENPELNLKATEEIIDLFVSHFEGEEKLTKEDFFELDPDEIASIVKVLAGQPQIKNI